MIKTIDIFNYQVVDSRLAIGGQPTVSQFKQLQQAGFDIIFQINVDEANYDVKNEAFHVHYHQMKHVSMNMSYINPTLENLQEFLRLIDQYKDKHIYAHCATGVCTSGLLALHRIMEEKLSLDDIMSTGTFKNWVLNEGWLKLIDEVTSIE